MADGWWSWGDLSAFGTLGAFAVSIGTLVHLRGRRDEAASMASRDATDAKKTAEKVALDLADYKLQSAEKFVPRGELSAMETRLSDRIDGLGTRVEASISKIGERMDRIAEKAHG